VEKLSTLVRSLLEAWAREEDQAVPFTFEVVDEVPSLAVEHEEPLPYVDL